MTRKDYILLAGALLEARRMMPHALSSDPAINRIQAEAVERTFNRVLTEVTDVLKADNGQFKPELFIQAATGECPLNARRVR